MSMNVIMLRNGANLIIACVIHYHTHPNRLQKLMMQKIKICYCPMQLVSIT